MNTKYTEDDLKEDLKENYAIDILRIVLVHRTQLLHHRHVELR